MWEKVYAYIMRIADVHGIECQTQAVTTVKNRRPLPALKMASSLRLLALGKFYHQEKILKSISTFLSELCRHFDDKNTALM